jgi:alpha-galactosidase
MHFACAVAMSVRYGMDLDLTKLNLADKAVCAGAIKAYKRIRDVTQLGDLYRLENPYDSIRSALNYVSKDHKRAVLFVFQLRDGEVPPVRPQGLAPEKQYIIHELDPLPSRTALLKEGKSFSGEILMRDGIIPSCAKAAEACVVELQ